LIHFDIDHQTKQNVKLQFGKINFLFPSQIVDRCIPKQVKGLKGAAPNESSSLGGGMLFSALR
jgi:hypothetical protein